MLKDTVQNYGVIAKLFHWVMALLMIGMLAMGNFLGAFPKEWRSDVFLTHKSLGLLILFLVILRIIWRFMNKTPEISHRTPFYIRYAGYAAHGLLYIGMIIMPLSGWIFASHKYPLTFFNWFTVPYISAADDKWLHHLAIETHAIAGNLLIFLIGLHIVAALYHQFILRDKLINRMI